MTKKEWRQQADSYLQQVIQLLQCYADVGYIGQEPYKGRFFKVFADAFRSGFCTAGYRFDVQKGDFVRCKAQRPLITGDAIWTYAKSQGWTHAEMTGGEKRYRDIEMVRTWWDEWIYAWKRPIPPRKYVRRKSQGEA